MAKSEAKIVGENVKFEISGRTLKIEIDLDAKPYESGSGKTLIVASTQGNKLMGDVRVGLNAYRYPDKKKEKKSRK